MKKENKKLASAIILGLMMYVPVVANANITEIGSSESSDDDIKIEGNYDIGIYKGNSNGIASNYTGKNIVIDTKPGSGWGNGNVGVWANEYDPSWDFKVDDSKRNIINLGGNKTDNISINIVDNNVKDPNIAIGLWASGGRNEMFQQDKLGGQINVKSKMLKITGYSELGGVYGIYAQNKTTASKQSLAEININADNTYINVGTGEKALGTGDAIVAMSQGKININSNLEVYADNAIIARGDSVIKVNEDGAHTTKLNGDINFNYDGSTSGTKVDADVIVNLKGADSYWNGNTTVTWNYKSTEKPEDSKLTVKDFKLIIADGAQWNPNKIERIDEVAGGQVSGKSYLALNNLTLNDGIINLDKMEGQALKIEKLAGAGGIVNTNSLENSIKVTNIEEGSSPFIIVNGSGEIADAIYKNKEKAQDLANVLIKENKSIADKVTTNEGVIAGKYIFNVKDDGIVDTTNYDYRKNTKNEAISNMASIALMAWRAENNDMNKRLGELRNGNGEYGIWARMMRGESEYGTQSIKNQYNTYQLGYDEKLSTNNHWTVGAAISYTDGQSSFENGSGENTNKGLSLYGSYLGDNGEYVDLIAKYARLNNEFDVLGGVGKGDYSTNGYSFSAEFGKRNQLSNDFYIEPQVELTYGTVSDVDFITQNGANVSQDSIDSLVGRIGFMAGKNIKNGNVYLRASYLYDFDGETNVTFSNAGISESFSEDLGGGWFEFGVGTNINLSDATYLYFDIEKTTGGEVDTNWQWNAGVRYSF